MGGYASAGRHRNRMSILKANTFGEQPQGLQGCAFMRPVFIFQRNWNHIRGIWKAIHNLASTQTLLNPSKASRCATLRNMLVTTEMKYVK